VGWSASASKVEHTYLAAITSGSPSASGRIRGAPEEFLAVCDAWLYEDYRWRPIEFYNSLT